MNMTSKDHLPQPHPHHREFFQVVIQFQDIDEAARFFRDLLTHGELEDIAKRVQIADRLYHGKTYAEIAKELNVSTTTVGKVAAWYHRGEGGLKVVLDRHHRAQKT